MYDTILDATAFSKSLEYEIKNASKIELFSAFIKEDTLMILNIGWLIRKIQIGDLLKNLPI